MLSKKSKRLGRTFSHFAFYLLLAALRHSASCLSMTLSVFMMHVVPSLYLRCDDRIYSYVICCVDRWKSSLDPVV
jgi:hypothetical protein